MGQTLVQSYVGRDMGHEFAVKNPVNPKILKIGVQTIFFYLTFTGSVLFCSVLFCSVLFCSVLFCSVLFCSVL
ncbi:MAG: hypothetical protein FWC26_10180, partial [Fibromonadales bacterium]|nr:hypothetical protein [Fibromonadales bacterium]